MKNFISHKSLLKEYLRDPEFKKEYDASAPEFEAMEKEIRARIQLKELRIKKGITQKELAGRMDTKQTSISRFEQGRYNPTISFIARVAEALGKKMTIEFK